MEANKSNSLQDTFLESCRRDQIALSVFLVNGIRLLGKVEAFDAYVILLRGGGTTQLVYKHAVSTILPAEYVELGTETVKPTRQQQPQPVFEPLVAAEPISAYEVKAKSEVVVKKRVSRRIVSTDVEAV